MAVRNFRISDLTGDIVKDDDLVQIVLLDHPLIEEPVQLDASAQDLKGLSGSGKDYAVLEVLSDGGDKRERMVLEVDEFEKLFTVDVDDALRDAEKVSYGRPSAPSYVEETPRRRGRPAGSAKAATGEKTNYKELPAAGLQHRGRTTEEEAATVRANLDEVNRNRVAAGQPPIDPQNEKDAARYGFDKMAAADRPKLSPEFKA